MPKIKETDFNESMLLMMAYNTIKTLPEDSSIKDKVLLLNQFNLTNEQIATVCGTSSKIVSNYKNEMIKKKNRNAK